MVAGTGRHPSFPGLDGVGGEAEGPVCSTGAGEASTGHLGAGRDQTVPTVPRFDERNERRRPGGQRARLRTGCSAWSIPLNQRLHSTAGRLVCRPPSPVVLTCVGHDELARLVVEHL